VQLAVVAGRRLLEGEVDARGAVQLAHDHALGAVDDELAAPDHDRDLAEIDLFLDRLGLDQAQADLEGVPVGQAQLPALVDRVARPTELVADVLEAHRLVVRVDREHLAQEGLEALELAVRLDDVGGQELVPGLRLDLDEVGELDDRRIAAERTNGRVGLNHRELLISSRRIAGGEDRGRSLDLGGAFEGAPGARRSIGRSTSASGQDG
jgi:hypothetical protein